MRVRPHAGTPRTWRSTLIDRLERIANSDTRTVIGLSSGTSYDGIDAALVRVDGRGDDVSVEVLSFECVPFEAELRARVAGAPEATAPELTRLNVDVGEAFAAAARALCERSAVGLSDVDLIGSHGQTVWHEPPEGGRGGATLQIGEADVIAHRTGVVTVADFRTADVAAGGAGAPLVPLVDWLLFRAPGEARVLLNIGGIANITYVPEKLDDVVAFDTGPGNALLDELVRLATGDPEAIDEGGSRALAGRADERAADEFLAHLYFTWLPPKSTGKETFGREAALSLAALVHPGRELAELAGQELSDLLATAASITTRSIHDAMRLLPGAGAVDRVIASGGGVRNRAIMAGLAELFAPRPVVSLSELGMNPDAKEAVAFAVLADRTLAGLPGNVPAATGASRPVVLGKISAGF